ncbi:uncharacterized protein V1518DRAFT_430101 [Limtongia smithiae]|uniref:uncharacterized protein n=1 Tax=Limtongia smithiae TaxID=1125753 RepID=UPI0034CF00B0
MPRATKGVLVECDPAIKSLILSFDAKYHNIVILVRCILHCLVSCPPSVADSTPKDLDDEHLLIDEKMVDHVKRQLEVQLAQNMYNPAEQESDEQQK